VGGSTARLRLRCSGAPCRGEFRLWYGHILAANGSYSLNVGQSAPFSARLDPKILKLLQHSRSNEAHRALDMEVTVTAVGGATLREHVSLRG
jgi:hypothetical protein